MTAGCPNKHYDTLFQRLAGVVGFFATVVFSPQHTSKLVCVRLIENVGIFATTFSRHAKAHASLALVVWLIENVGFFATVVFSPQHTSKLVCVRLIENVGIFATVVLSRHRRRVEVGGTNTAAQTSKEECGWRCRILCHLPRYMHPPHRLSATNFL